MRGQAARRRISVISASFLRLSSAALASAGGEDAQRRARYISPFSIESEFQYSPDVDLYLLDDCEKLSPVAQIDASARLVCDVARRWQIPRDRLHIVAHGQLQPYNRTDPGANWPWADYLARIDRYCTG